jgi:hypothetical protein
MNVSHLEQLLMISRISLYLNGQSKDLEKLLVVMDGNSSNLLDKIGKMISYLLKEVQESESKIFSNV